MSEEPAPDTTEAEPRPDQVAEDPAVAPPAARKRSGFGIALLLGVSALAVAVAWFDPLNWRGEGNLPALQQEVAALKDALAAALTAQAGLEGRFAALESKPAVVSATPESVAQLEERLASAEATLQALAAAPANADGSIPAASFAALQAAVAGLKSDLAAMGSASGAVPADAVKAAVDAAMTNWITNEAAKAQAQLDAGRAAAARALAVETIRAALTSGAPFAESLPALAGTDISKVLKDHADLGLPTLTVLAAEFPEAARKALDASLRASPDDPSLTGRLLGFLRVQTGARSLAPREGTDPDAVLSRAEAAVKAGDVTLALTELSGLPPDGLAEMAAWSDKAGLYLMAEQAITALAASVGP